MDVAVRPIQVVRNSENGFYLGGCEIPPAWRDWHNLRRWARVKFLGGVRARDGWIF